MLTHGECKVTINRDQDKKLKPGEIFGEISLVFNTQCTATVSCTKFCSLAKLDKTSLDVLMMQFPPLEKILKKKVYRYGNDFNFMFILSSLKLVPFLSHGSNEDLYDVMFTL